MTTPMLAGTARRKLTPAQTVDLSGYGLRQQPMTGVHDDILVRSLCLAHGSDKAVICTMDLLSLDFQQVTYIREKVAAFDIRPDRLILACSHTHGGPAMQYLRLCGTPTPAYVQWALDEVVQTILESIRSLRPVARAVAGAAECDLAINRRQATGAGVQIGYNPEGELDQTLSALKFVAEDEETIATLFNYACHGVVLGGENREISADWPGEACRMAEAAYGGEAMFIQGCCGDVNPRIRGGFDQVKKAAALAAASLDQALESARELAGWEISSQMNEVALPLQQLPSDDELRSVVDSIRQLPREQWTFEQQRDDLWASGALDEPSKSRASFLPVQTGHLTIGNLVLAWIPAEAFGAFALELRQKRAGRPTMVAGYCNGNIGYLPTRAAFAEGGYEVTEAYRYYGYQMIGEQSEDLVKQSLAGAL